MARPLVIPVITGSALAATAVFTAARAVRADRRARAAKQVAETQRQESNASQQVQFPRSMLRVEEETVKTSLET